MVSTSCLLKSAIFRFKYGHGSSRNQLNPSLSPLPAGDCIAMSLRGSETTEAISQGVGNKEIATLSAFARNDKKGIMTQNPGDRGWG